MITTAIDTIIMVRSHFGSNRFSPSQPTVSMTQVAICSLDNELEWLSGELGRMCVEMPAIFAWARTKYSQEFRALEAAR